MARQISAIQNDIIAEVQATPELAAASSPSKRALWRLWTYIVATAQGVFEQLQDNEVSNIENIIAAAHAGHSLWIQNEMLLFQYDATTPQIIQLQTADPTAIDYLSYYYPTVDTTKRIITRCSVNRAIYNTVQIKVASDSGKLNTTQISAAQDYIDIIGDAAANYQVISLDSDKLFIEGDVYYKGQYTNIQTTVEAAINSYLASISQPPNLNGKIKITDLIAAIKSATGVDDFVPKNIASRADTISFSSKTHLINNYTELQKDYQSVAGYVTEETNSGNTWGDKINYIPV